MEEEMSQVAKVTFADYEPSISKALDLIGAGTGSRGRV